MRNCPFAGSDKSQSFAGGRFYGDPLDGQCQHVCDISTHTINVRRDCGGVQNHGGIDVHDSVTVMREQLSNMPQQEQARYALIALIRIGKMSSDISERGRPKERIGYGMKEHIGIGVTFEPLRTRDVHPAEDQLPLLHKAMDIVPEPNPQRILNGSTVSGSEYDGGLDSSTRARDWSPALTVARPSPV